MQHRRLNRKTSTGNFEVELINWRELNLSTNRELPVPSKFIRNTLKENGAVRCPASGHKAERNELVPGFELNADAFGEWKKTVASRQPPKFLGAQRNQAPGRLALTRLSGCPRSVPFHARGISVPGASPHRSTGTRKASTAEMKAGTPPGRTGDNNASHHGVLSIPSVLLEQCESSGPGSHHQGILVGNAELDDLCRGARGQ